MPRIYLSASTQESNLGIAPFTNEEAEMNQIVDKLIPILAKDGRFETRRNTRDMTPYQSAADSNSFGPNIHIAIHSNAGGGVGTEVYAYGAGTNSERLAKALYKHVAPISPGADRGIKFNPQFTEVGDKVTATACLIELAFHDNATDALWLATQEVQIAEALYRGICDYFVYVYRALAVTPVIVPPVVPEVAYRIILDGKQVMAVAEQAKAIEAVKKAVDEGGAILGIVQRTDGVNVLEYTKPVVATPVIDEEKDQLKAQVAELAAKIALLDGEKANLFEQLNALKEKASLVDELARSLKLLLG